MKVKSLLFEDFGIHTPEVLAALSGREHAHAQEVWEKMLAALTLQDAVLLASATGTVIDFWSNSHRFFD